MESTLKTLRRVIPHIRFEAGNTFFWSPETQLITYRQDLGDEPDACWALLHEAAHALLGHTRYETDFELLLLEVEAWQKAKELGATVGLDIDEEHIQDCLDTYRDWLHQRSTCPICVNVSMQETPEQYHCHNCSTEWRVTTSRFCRPYRLRRQSHKGKRSSEPTTQTTFH
jgi:hypothetical protein